MAKTKKQASDAVALMEPTNGAEDELSMLDPYSVEVRIEGTAPILFHRWNVESIDEKAKAAKGSAIKKSDDVESYLYRDNKGEICIPGEYLRQAIIAAAKSKQDPRSPRKSACDLFKAGVICDTYMASTGEKDYILDRRRVTVQRNGITRSRPCLEEGWTATFQFTILTPEYISFPLFSDVLTNAGRLVGLADFRPTFGRFHVTKIERY